MDLLSVLQAVARQISLQKDKTEALIQQEATLRRDLKTAQEQHRQKRRSMEEEQQKHFAVVSEVQHQEAAISECQAANAALKQAIKEANTERKRTWAQLEQLQDSFVQSSGSLCAEMQALSTQAHNSLSAGDVSMLDQLRRAVPAGVREQAAKAAADRVADVHRRPDHQVAGAAVQ